MANTISLLSDETVQYEGLFDLKELYHHMHKWLTWRGFSIEEKKYAEKLKPGGKEIEIEWESGKDVDEYSRFVIKVNWKLRGINDAEVKKDSRTIKMQKGEIKVVVSADLVTDKQDFWAQNVLYSFLRGFYDRYIYRSALERLKGELWKIGWDFYNEVKAFLQLYKY